MVREACLEVWAQGSVTALAASVLVGASVLDSAMNSLTLEEEEEGMLDVFPDVM